MSVAEGPVQKAGEAAKWNDPGQVVLARRSDAVPTLPPLQVELGYVPLQADEHGALWVRLSEAVSFPAGLSLEATQITIRNILASVVGTLASSTVNVTVTGTPAVSISGTVPVSVSTLPLPSGAATESTLSAAKSDLDTMAAAMGVTPYTLVSANSTNATSVKASVGTLYGWAVYNNSTSPMYCKIFNKGSAPTVGTDTPVLNIMIPSGGSAVGGGSNLGLDGGVAFSAGIAFCLTNGAALLDASVVPAAAVLVNLFYK